MPKHVELGPWRVACDPEATRAAYAAITEGTPDSCSCGPCRNWRALRPTIYTPRLRALLDGLGIIPEREYEVYETGAREGGLLHYSGFWHFVGRIEVDAGGWWSPPEVDLRLMVLDGGALPAPSFGDARVLHLEFEAQLPWVIAGSPPKP